MRGGGTTRRHVVPGGAKRCAAAEAWIVFEDESGCLIRPPKAKTWGRRGRTPVVTVRGRGSGRVSIAGLTCYRPGHRSRLIYRLHVYRGRRGEKKGFGWGSSLQKPRISTGSVSQVAGTQSDRRSLFVLYLRTRSWCGHGVTKRAWTVPGDRTPNSSITCKNETVDHG
jgi:hypothetical protein